MFYDTDIVVDIDVKGFFDNISHGKLLKQLWTMGIQDKKLISILSAMLKGEIAEIGFPENLSPDSTQILTGQRQHRPLSYIAINL